MDGACQFCGASTTDAAAHCPRCRRTRSGRVAAEAFRRSDHPAAVNFQLNLPPDLAALQQSGKETAGHTLPAPTPVTKRPQPGLRSEHVDLFARQPDRGGPAASCPGEVTAGLLPPNAIAGHRLDGVIGHGGMGTVYLGRQVSLDRPVAVKVMSKEWASDPVFVARFVREAYAAAQLNHPNVVQIYDIGEVLGGRYFTMEYVKGKSLADVVKARGKLEVEAAVGYILQAARGLKHAHDRGIIHRDIKPDNLLLDEFGVVKVADLGLVKTPDLTAQQDTLADERRCRESGLHTLPPDMTGARMALGTPAYMAPEQCRDASAVDHRADIYSLGCTLYALLTGTQPFHAANTIELMKKQAYEPPVPPEQLNPRIPADVSAIVCRMMAKLPADRYRSMGEVVRTLEQWLGVQSNGKFLPREEQIAEMERVVGRFYASPVAHARHRTVSGFLFGCAVAAVLVTFFGHISYTFGLAGLILHAAVVNFALNGWSGRTYLYRRLRRFAAGLSVGDWLVTAGAVGLFTAFLWMSGLLTVWVGCGLIGVAAGVALWAGFDQRMAAERFPAVEEADGLARRLRAQGVAEAEAKLFFAKYAGKRWEEFFEAVFGFEAKLAVRADLRGRAVGTRPKFAAWREPLVALCNHVEAARQKAREREMLENAEFQRLIAAGTPRAAARDQAAATAAALVEQASVIRESTDLNRPDAPSQSGVIAFRPLLRSNAVAPGLAEPPTDYFSEVADRVIGKAVRGVLAAVLVAACGLWVFQNGLLRWGRVDEIAPLALPGVPAEWTAWCDTANVGWGGVLLLASLFYRGKRMAGLTLLGAGVTVLGHKLGIRTVEPVRDYHVAMFLGTVLALVGYRLGRR